jgi:putative SOS response-associated peptidase YedK
MCGRYTRYSSWAEVYAFTQPLDVQLPDAEVPPQYNIAPSQPAWVIAPDQAGRLAAQEMRWGYLPRWAKDPPLQKRPMPRPINARADTVATSGMFRGSFADRRCVVIANGWYEWREELLGDKPVKQPYYFTPADGAVLGFAGVFDVIRGPDGAQKSFAIITTSAGPVAGEIHDRMPIVLAKDDLDLWLDPRTEKRDAQALLAGVEPENLVQVRVSRAVNSPKNDTPALVQPEG